LIVLKKIIQNLKVSSHVFLPSVGLQSNRWSSSSALQTYRTKTNRTASLGTSVLSSGWYANDALNLRLRTNVQMFEVMHLFPLEAFPVEM
jgi:hypothetical protein